MSEKLHAELSLFLSHHHVVTLAYHDVDGVGACGLWYVYDDDLNLYFITSPVTRHGRALLNGGDVAFTIHRDDQDWHAIQGLQGKGRCAPLPPAQVPRVWRLYVQRYPQVLQQFKELDAALKNTMFWLIRPAWFRLVRNQNVFGYETGIIFPDH